MGSFLRKGYRDSKKLLQKTNKKRINKILNITHQLDSVAKEIIKSHVVITEENIVEEASRYTDLPIGKLEKHILNAKLYSFYQALKEKRENESKQIDKN